MPYPPKSTHVQTFEAGMNSDLADEVIPKNVARYFLNCQAQSSADGNVGVVTSVMGNVMITTPLPAGTNKTIAARSDEKNNKFYFLVWNSNFYHTWFVYDELLNRIIPFLSNLTDTDGVDIMHLDVNYPVLHVDLVIGTNIETGVDNTLIYWCDALNKGRKTNIQKCLDKSRTGYGYHIIEDFITAYKKCPVYAPVPTYFTDVTRNSNFMYAQLFKFCYRYVYDDGEISNYSDWSMVALPPNQSYQGVGAVTNDNNGISLHINSGGQLVKKIEIAMLTTGISTVNSVEVQGAALKWVTVAILDKDQLLIADNAGYNHLFYNDGSYPAADQAKIIRPYSFLFRIPVTQAFVKTAMTYTGGDEGFPSVKVNVGVQMNYQPLFIPPGTVNQFNSPAITITQTAYTTTESVFQVVRYNPVIQFIIGHDVKKGNVYTISGSNGTYYAPFDPLNIFGHAGSDHYFFQYTADLADTAVSVANRIKAYLRGIGRGIPDAHNGISGESVDGPGNATFFYTYLGRYRENITKFTGTVTPVEYATLQNNGVSIQVIKSGSIRQYAIGYEDDDGRKSPGYTSDGCIIRTPFLTEAPGGVIQQPIHQVSVFHQPPVWARYWMLYRTPDEINYIQILVQKVIDVVVIAAANPGEYLDLVIGSLFTYQQIHPDVILAYQFTRGDRVRLIRNTTTGNFYTPFFETEVLSYSEVTTEQRNAQITTFGTNLVTPADGVLTDYIGKNIQIAGNERTIIGITGGQYILDGVLNIGSVIATVIEPSYTFIDRRGIVRIAKPAGYTIVDFSTIEIYTPQKNTDNLDYKLFNDTAQKFDVSNFGTATRAHRGSHQDQDGTSATTLVATPAVILVTEGDAYIRNREMPTNNQLLNTEVYVDIVEDPNFSDFYLSALNNLGRVFAKDNGTVQKHFDSRTRFSNNYITDTAINGLNDFDNLDREDNNDSHGAVKLSKFIGNKLYLFKENRDTYVPVQRSVISTAAGVQILGLSEKLLGPMVYLDFDGGIGNNPESWFQNENYQYHAMPNSGVFVRLAGDGIDPISILYGFDKQSRDVLSAVRKYNLRLYGAFDKKNGNAFWSAPSYIPSIFNNPFSPADWNTLDTAVPNGATVVIVTQPANGVVTYDGTNFNINMNADYVGTDTFTYKFSLPGGGFSAIKNACINSVARTNNTVAYRARAGSHYCTKILSSGSYVNDGNESWSVLEGYYLEDNTLSGFIMPNVQFISPDAIVPDGSAITYNETTSPAPSGGANGDVWFNEPVNKLYKKIAGVWTLLTNRVINNYFVSPLQNLTDCPLPAPPAGNNFSLYAQYGMEIVSVVNGTCTGVPAGFATENLMPPGLDAAAYTTVGAGTVTVTLDGSPTPFGHVKVTLYAGGVAVSDHPVGGPGPVTLTFPATYNNPTPIKIALETY